MITAALAFCVSGAAAQIKIGTTDYQFIRQRLYFGADTSKYFTGISHGITGFSTHRQAPSAKAVFDFVSTSASTVTTAAPVGGTGTALDPVTIGNAAIQYAKIQNVTAQRLVGNPSGSASAPSEISLGSGLGWSGSSIVNTATALTDGDKGDVDVTGSGAVWTVDTNAITTVKITNDAVTYAKIQNVAAQRILGRSGGLAGDAEELTLGTGMGWSGSAITNTGDTDASNDLTTSTIFGGDVAGTADDLEVQAWLGRPLNGTAPTNGQVYAWNAGTSQWVPTTVGGGSGTAFEQGGNSFGTAARLGTNDLNRLEFETNNTYAGKVHTNQSWLIGGATTDVPGTKLHVAGDFRADGTVISRGAGVATGSTTASSLRLWNTTASTGQTYNLSSADAGSLILWDPFGFQALTLTTSLNFGVYKNIPGRRWDVSGVSRSDVFENSNVNTPTLGSFGTGAGTSPTNNGISGGQNYFVFTFTTGSSPTAGGVVATISLPTAFTVAPVPVWSAGNDATDASRFRVGTVTASTFQIVNRGGALTASTQYVLYIHVGGY